MYWIWQVACNWLLKDWNVVSIEEARQDAHFGLRGWLLVFYFMYTAVFVVTLIGLFSPPDPTVLEQTYGGKLWVMRGMEVMYLAVIAPVLVLASREHPLTPKVWIGSMWVGVIASTLLSVVALPDRLDKVLLGAAITGAAASLMTWYILHSKRVNITYLNRVPA